MDNDARFWRAKKAKHVAKSALNANKAIVKQGHPLKCPVKESNENVCVEVWYYT